jgi:hypothetical protein
MFTLEVEPILVHRLTILISNPNKKSKIFNGVHDQVTIQVAYRSENNIFELSFETLGLIRVTQPVLY